MKLLKQNFVVPVAAIQVQEQFTIKTQSKQSLFSNGYDIERAAKSLGDKTRRASLSDKDPDFSTWEIFKAHEKLLKQHIENSTGRKLTLQWGEYDISHTQDERFSKVGNLSNTDTDFVQIHTKQGVRMWDGNNDKTNGKRWPGIRYGLRLANELTVFASKDNPFAQAALLRLEDDLLQIENYFSEVQSSIANQLSELGKNGINITIVGNPDPVLIQLNSVYQVTVYTQTWTDVEAKIGSTAKAGQIGGNLNTMIMLRVKTTETAEMLTKQLPDVKIMTSTLVSRANDVAFPESHEDFSSGNEDRIGSETVPMLAPSDLTQLPKGQAFALIEGGQLYKLRLPLPKKDPNENIPSHITEIAKAMRQKFSLTEPETSEQAFIDGKSYN